MSAAQLSPQPHWKLFTKNGQWHKAFRPCSNCSGTMSLCGTKAFSYYACPDCGDALDTRLAEESSDAQ